MGEKVCTSCKKLQEIMAIGVNAPTWYCYDCGKLVEPKETTDDGIK